MCGGGGYNDVPTESWASKMQDRNEVSECVTGQFSINKSEA